MNGQNDLSDKLNYEEVLSIINKYPECKGNLGKNAKATAEKPFKTMFEENFPDDEDWYQIITVGRGVTVCLQIQWNIEK